MTESIIVEKNFSRAPEYYHQHAITQHYVADKLASLIQFHCNGKVQRILEIGCGTGFLTEKLFSFFPEADFTITDLSGTMLSFCKKQTQQIRSEKNISVKFAENDISMYCPGSDYSLIVSSLAFQWVQDLETVIKRLQSKLLPNGQLIFSTQSEGTFAGIKETFAEEEVDFPGPELLTADEIKSVCRNFNSIEISNETRIEEYKSMLTFLRHIQGTGAGNATGKPLPTSELKKIINDPSRISAEYNITYVACQ